MFIILNKITFINHVVVQMFRVNTILYNSLYKYVQDFKRSYDPRYMYAHKSKHKKENTFSDIVRLGLYCKHFLFGFDEIMS